MGDAMNWPGFGDILDEKMAAQLSMLMLQGQAGGEPAPPTPRQQPRMSGDMAKPAVMGYGGGGKPAAKTQPMAAKKQPMMEMAK